MLHPHPTPSACDRAPRWAYCRENGARNCASARGCRDGWKTRASVFSFPTASRWRELTLLQVSITERCMPRRAQARVSRTSSGERGALAHRCSSQGSARVSRVGFGVSPKQSLEKSAITRRHRQHARRVRYPGESAAVASHRLLSKQKREARGGHKRKASFHSEHGQNCFRVAPLGLRRLRANESHRLRRAPYRWQSSESRFRESRCVSDRSRWEPATFHLENFDR